MHAVLYFIRSPKETSDESVGLVTWPPMLPELQPLGSKSTEKTWPKWATNQNQIHSHVWPDPANQGQSFSSYSMSCSIESNSFTPSFLTAYRWSLFDLVRPPLRFQLSYEDIPSSTLPKTEKEWRKNALFCGSPLNQVPIKWGCSCKAVHVSSIIGLKQS